ncbi:MAG TPA: heme o synthase [Gallionellaceae bacterium]|nr:heme o synthase [Gallionellaceae bacterium]
MRIAGDYLGLTKPGIIFGNLIAVAGGLFLGSRGDLSAQTFLASLTGIALVIGGGCALNNFIDRDIDALMLRTRNRSLVKKRVPPSHALILGFLLSICGLSLLALYTNMQTTLVTFVGLLVYVVLYSLWLKRSPHGTWVGSIAGAAPPVAGYCAASGHLDLAALVLFAMYALWQLPHAYAIAILHVQDYARAAIPVLPVVRGVARVKRHMPLYVAVFTLCALLLFFTHNTGLRYLAVMLLLGVAWIRSTWRDRKCADDRRWARKSFGYSILAVMAMSLMMSVDFIPKPALNVATIYPATSR